MAGQFSFGKQKDANEWNNMHYLFAICTPKEDCTVIPQPHCHFVLMEQILRSTSQATWVLTAFTVKPFYTTIFAPALGYAMNKVIGYASTIPVDNSHVLFLKGSWSQPKTSSSAVLYSITDFWSVNIFIYAAKIYEHFIDYQLIMPKKKSNIVSCPFPCCIFDKHPSQPTLTYISFKAIKIKHPCPRMAAFIF